MDESEICIYEISLQNNVDIIYEDTKDLCKNIYEV